MSRAYDDAMEERFEAAIAKALGISSETLGYYPFQIDENASSDGLLYGYRILWDENAPPGVEKHGSVGAYWSDVQIEEEPDGPEN